MKLELFFDTSKYVKISNPSFSIGGDIVLRGKTIDGEIKHIVAFDNSIYKFPAHEREVCHHYLSLDWEDHFKSNPFFVTAIVV